MISEAYDEAFERKVATKIHDNDTRQHVPEVITTSRRIHHNNILRTIQFDKLKLFQTALMTTVTSKYSCF